MRSKKDYRSGVIIFEAHSNDAQLVAALNQGESPFRKILLEKSMRQLLETEQKPVAEETPPPVVAKEEPIVVVGNKQKATDDPYAEHWKPLYAEVNFLRHQLTTIDDIAERGKTAHRICDLIEECYRYWGLRDYYQKHGYKKKDEADIKIATDQNALRKELNNVRSYVTKYKKKVKEEPYNNNAIEKLEELQKRKQELEKILNVKPTRRHIKYNKSGGTDRSKEL